LSHTNLLLRTNYNILVYPKNHDVVEDKENYISEDDQKRLIEALDSNELEGIIFLMGLMWEFA